MNEYIEVLKFYVSQNPPAYTRDANSILELLYYYYRERKAEALEAIKEDFDDLYRQMHGINPREMDRIVDDVCTLCREHGKAGFLEGLKVGTMIERELSTNKTVKNIKHDVVL